MIQYLSDIEIDLWEFIELINKNERNIPDNELLNLKLVIELTNDWVKEYNNKILPLN
jgi:hypothetical protein